MIRKPQFNLSKITSELVGMEYKLGKMDCFMLIMAYLKKRKIEVPDVYQGLTLDTYKDLYMKDSVKAKRIMVQFMDEHLDPVHSNKAAPGDIYLLKYKDQPEFLAICGGNAQIICAAEKQGVTPVAIRHYRIERAWKCRQQSQ